MNELKPEDVMRALECHTKRRCYDCPLGKEEIEDLSKPCSTMIAELSLALLREKDAEIERLKNLIFTIKQQMIGDLEAIWYEGHGFIEYDDLKRWKEQYIKNGQM